MPTHSDSRFINRLIAEVDRLLQGALDFELLYATELQQVAPDFVDSARNLLHYLGVRHHDIRKLQDDLSSLGLSSLGRMEAHTLATLEAVMGVLSRLDGHDQPSALERRPPVGFRAGPALLADHANALLGTPSSRRSGRVMVTMPSEAATDMGLIRRLLEAGMNIMRINCAHDDAEAWLAMIDNLRGAERELGQHCRILADLAGPKLRTGAIASVDQIVRIRPQRDTRGVVTVPAIIWLTPMAAPQPAPADMTAILPIEGDLLVNAEPGDTLEIVDCRGRQRTLLIVERQAASCVAECDRTSYVEAGMRLSRKRQGATVASARIGALAPTMRALTLFPGNRLRVTGEEQLGRPAVCDADGTVITPAQIPCTLGAIFQKVVVGERVWFDDGKIGGTIIDVAVDGFTVEISHAKPTGAKLCADKGINLPDTTFDMPAMTAKDYRDLDVIAGHVDMVGLSFVRKPEDVELLTERLAELGASALGVVLKIENRRAFDRLPRILLTALRSPPIGVMVARGDLAVEMGFERLAEVQEEILWMCEAAHVPVIWATQVLEGLAKTGAPSRAEVTDAAMSGRAECVMLNKGPYIVEATRFLSGVLARMEFHQSKKSATLRKLSVAQMIR